MNWKDTLRKAPFSLGVEQGKVREEFALKKKELLKLLQSLLVQHVDKPFRNQIRQNDEARAYTIQLQNTPFFAEIMKLKGRGLKNLDIEEHLVKEYDVEDVMLDYGEKTITFEK